jgi:anaerobic selenocysteine-containing dehydrogenase
LTVKHGGEDQTVHTFCRVCEPMCALVATVRDGRLTSVAGDKDSPYSKGHFCKKATGAVEVMYDPDRILQPLKRTGKPGEFTPVPWDEAMSDIATRLQDIRRRDGPSAFATFLGQPPTNGFATAVWFSAFKQVFQTKWNYSVNAEDAASLLMASELLFGSALLYPRPDLWRSDFAIIIGANPMVSHGSVCTEPLMRDALQSIVKRGGRVVVIDPRRSETAQSFEHVQINAGTDAWLMMALLNELISNQSIDLPYIRENCDGLEELAELARPFTSDRASEECGVPADVIRDLARDFAKANSATIYGRTGTCTQRFGTLNNILQSLLCIVTGNLDRPGGALFTWSSLGANAFPATRETTVRSRIGGLPALGGMLPSRCLIDDILTPGEGQVRALLMLGGNPVHSSGAAGKGFADALEKLDLHFSLDIYMNETNRHAHYILPVATMFERADIPYKYLANMLRPALFATEAVVKPSGDVREEWEILNELCRRAGLGGAYSNRWLRRLSAIGLALRPKQLMDWLIRKSSNGDQYGWRRGLSMRKLLRRFPNGVSLADALPTDILKEVIATPDRKIILAGADFRTEVQRLSAHRHSEAFPFRLTGMREMLSMNTWLHNVPSCMTAKRRHQLHISPFDASRLSVADGQVVTVKSEAGVIRVPVKISDRMKEGNVALPHGWGHGGGWQRANAAPGVNSNILAAKNSKEIEALAGMSILNGIAVAIEV